MSDELQHRIDRGKRAEALVNDPLLVEAFGGVVQSYYQDWLNTAPSAVQEREIIYLKARQMGEVRQRLLSVAQDGTLAQHAADNPE